MSGLTAKLKKNDTNIHITIHSVWPDWKWRHTSRDLLNLSQLTLADIGEKGESEPLTKN